MYIRLEIPPDCVATVGRDGPVVEESIIIRPRFTRSGGTAIFCYGIAYAELEADEPAGRAEGGLETVDEFSLSTSGKTGRVMKHNYKANVIPLVDGG